MPYYSTPTTVFHNRSPFFGFVPEPGPTLELVFELSMLKWGMVPSSCHYGNLVSLMIIFEEDQPDAFGPAILPKIILRSFPGEAGGKSLYFSYRVTFPNHFFGM